VGVGGEDKLDRIAAGMREIPPLFTKLRCKERHFRHSPNGRWIAYLEALRDELSPFGGVDDPWVLMASDPSGKRRRRLTDAAFFCDRYKSSPASPRDCAWVLGQWLCPDHHPVWSPDGRYIAIEGTGFKVRAGQVIPDAVGVVGLEEKQGLLIIEVDTEPARVVGGEPLGATSRPTWDPAGRRVAILAGRAQEEALVIVDVESFELEAVPLPHLPSLYRSKICGAMDWALAWRPQGDEIAVGLTQELGTDEFPGDLDYRTSVFLFDLARRAFRKTGEVLGELLSVPQWSGDGRKLVFVAGDSSHPMLYLAVEPDFKPRKLDLPGRSAEDPWDPEVEAAEAVWCGEERDVLLLAATRWRPRPLLLEMVHIFLGAGHATQFYRHYPMLFDPETGRWRALRQFEVMDAYEILDPDAYPGIAALLSRWTR